MVHPLLPLSRSFPPPYPPKSTSFLGLSLEKHTNNRYLKNRKEKSNKL